jgi:hypothetical protein
MTDRHSWRTDGQGPNVKLTSRSIAKFSSLTNDLIECGEDVVGELDLSYRRLTHRCKPDTKAYYALSAKGKIEGSKKLSSEDPERRI